MSKSKGPQDASWPLCVSLMASFSYFSRGKPSRLPAEPERIRAIKHSLAESGVSSRDDAAACGGLGGASQAATRQHAKKVAMRTHVFITANLQLLHGTIPWETCQEPYHISSRI